MDQTRKLERFSESGSARWRNATSVRELYHSTRCGTQGRRNWDVESERIVARLMPNSTFPINKYIHNASYLPDWHHASATWDATWDHWQAPVSRDESEDDTVWRDAR